MLNRPATDPRNWYRNAFLHVFDCPHQNWWFLAWHRAYIGWLEATIREFSGDTEFALPYRDWTKTPRVPDAMFGDVLEQNTAAFIPTLAAFKPQFDAPVTALWAAFSPAQQDVLAQRGLASTADFWNAVAAAPAGMFFEQPAARGLTPGAPILIEPRGRRLRCPPSEAHCERRTSPAVPMAGPRLGFPARRRQVTTHKAAKAL